MLPMYLCAYDKKSNNELSSDDEPVPGDLMCSAAGAKGHKSCKIWSKGDVICQIHFQVPAAHNALHHHLYSNVLNTQGSDSSAWKFTVTTCATTIGCCQAPEVSGCQVGRTASYRKYCPSLNRPYYSENSYGKYGGLVKESNCSGYTRSRSISVQ